MPRRPLHGRRTFARCHMKRQSKGDGALFIEPSGQLRLIDKSAEQQTLERGKVECLGMTFESEEERQTYFIARLREKLTDLEFRQIEGFPLGEDDHILALSDPPYYTACPNPFIGEFLKHRACLYESAADDYPAEPFASDVFEGKQDPICMAHTYHTKVPYRAIARYILHY